MQWPEKAALRLLKWKYGRAEHRCQGPFVQSSGTDAEPNHALEPTAYSFGSAALRLRLRRRLTAGVDMTADVKRGEQLFYVCLMVFLLIYRKSRSQ
jgi:hypothetical protein